MGVFQHKDRPTCETENCTKLAAIVNDLGNGSAYYRKWCATCHSTKTAAKHGLTSLVQVSAKNQGFESVSDLLHARASAKGFDSYTDYKNSNHAYLKYRKSYCENIDGRLGFTCTTNVVWKGMLDVDHINGNHYDNNEANLQTLCKCCHAVKTNNDLQKN